MTEQLADSGALAALRRFYAAEEEYVRSDDKNFGIIAETLHDDIVIKQASSLPYGGEWKGHAGFESWMQAMNHVWSRLEHLDVQIFDAGQDTIFTRARAVVTLRANGQRYEFPILHQVTVRDDKIFTAEPFYWDTAALLAYLASAPE